jgi:hypothetical protein
MAICYVLLFAGITVEVISHNQSNPNAVFFAGKLINGFAIGGLLATALTYIGEVSLHNGSALIGGDSSLIASNLLILVDCALGSPRHLACPFCHRVHGRWDHHHLDHQLVRDPRQRVGVQVVFRSTVRGHRDRRCL